MRLLTVLHGAGLNAALLAGLLLMPTVIAVGFYAEAQHLPGVVTGLRGTFAGNP